MGNMGISNMEKDEKLIHNGRELGRCNRCGKCCRNSTVRIYEEDIERWEKEGREDILKLVTGKVGTSKGMMKVGWNTTGKEITHSSQLRNRKCPFLLKEAIAPPKEHNGLPQVPATGCKLQDTKPYSCRGYVCRDIDPYEYARSPSMEAIFEINHEMNIPREHWYEQASCVRCIYIIAKYETFAQLMAEAPVEEKWLIVELIMNKRYNEASERIARAEMESNAAARDVYTESMDETINNMNRLVEREDRSHISQVFKALMLGLGVHRREEEERLRKQSAEIMNDLSGISPDEAKENLEFDEGQKEKR